MHLRCTGMKIGQSCSRVSPTTEGGRADGEDLRLACEVCAEDCILESADGHPSSVRCRARGVAVNPPDHFHDPTVQVGLHLEQARLGPTH